VKIDETVVELLSEPRSFGGQVYTVCLRMTI